MEKERSGRRLATTLLPLIPEPAPVELGASERTQVNQLVVMVLVVVIG
jgi:hypothetical protein